MYIPATLVEVSLSSIHSLTHAEACGSMSLALGFVPARRHQVPADWPSPILRFLDPGKGGRRSASPKPSARRAAPQPPLSAA